MRTEGRCNSVVSVSTSYCLKPWTWGKILQKHMVQGSKPRFEIAIYHVNGERGKLESAPWSGLLKLWAS